LKQLVQQILAAEWHARCVSLRLIFEKNDKIQGGRRDEGDPFLSDNHIMA
jgi:hypothetical protein